MNSLRTYGNFAEQDAPKFLRECRAQVPDATCEEVAALIDETGPTIGDGARSKVAVLLKAVPKQLQAFVEKRRNGKALGAAAGGSQPQQESLRDRAIRVFTTKSPPKGKPNG